MGHGHGKYPPLLVDPAIEKWYHMRENTHVNFKFTNRVVRFIGVAVVGFPGLVYYLNEKYNVNSS